MSRGAQITLGVSMLVIAAGFVFLVPMVAGSTPGSEPIMLGLGSFSGLIALACLSTSSRPIVLRLLGGVVCLSGVWYLKDQAWDWMRALDGDWATRTRATKDLLRSLLFVGVFAIPGGYLACRGAYPVWGRYTRVFGVTESTEDFRS